MWPHEARRVRQSLGASFALGFVLATAAFSAEPKLARLTLELSPQVASKEVPWEGSVTLTPAASSSTKGLAPILRTLSATGTVSFSIPENSQWTVDASVAGWWAPQLEVEMEAANREIIYRLRLWPAATLKAQLVTTAKKEELPQAVFLELLAPPSTKTPWVGPLGRSICAVDKAGLMTCPMPAGERLNVSVVASGWVPHYRWNLTIERSDTQNLGQLPMQKGGSVTGWIAVEGSSIEKGKCRARLARHQTERTGRETADRRLSMMVETAVETDGFFQFRGVAPGVYQVEVIQDGFSPAIRAPLAVWKDKETRLTEPLILRRPLRIEVSISPATDWLGKPWTVSLDRLVSGGGSADDPQAHPRGTTDAKGDMILKSATPGTYSVQVLDSQGNRFRSDPAVEFAGLEVARHVIELSWIDVRGKLRYGGEPLAAVVWFGGRFGAQRVQMTSNEDGEFHGVLAREGPWEVAISSPQIGLESSKEVVVEANDSGVAVLDIDLLATKVFGRVVDSSGRPVEGAHVVAKNFGQNLRTSTEKEGTFTFLAVQEGKLLLSAKAQKTNAASLSVEVDVAEGRSPEEVVLRLRDLTKVQGRVVSAFGKIPGARVLVWPNVPLPGIPVITMSNEQGEFDAEVPLGTTGVLAVVSAPGHAFRVVQRRTDAEILEVAVGLEGGRIEFVSPLTAEDLRTRNLESWLSVDGIEIPFAELFNWSLGHGEPFDTAHGYSAPQLAPGHYRACLVPKRLSAVEQTVLDQRSLCAEGQLSAGGHLVLVPETTPSP